MNKSLSDEVMEILNSCVEIEYTEEFGTPVSAEVQAEQAHKAILKAVRERLPKKVKGCDGGEGKFGCCGRCFGAHYHNQAIEDMEKKLR